MAEVWNESYIAWESFQTPFFPLHKALHGIFSKHTENPMEKIQDSLENSESKGSFSQNTLKLIFFIGTFFAPNPFSLKFLITFSLVCE